MKRIEPQHLVVGAVIAAAAAIGFVLGGRRIAETPPQAIDAQPTAHVTTSTLSRGTLTASLELLGITVPRASDVHTYSVPFESQIVTVHVSRGQRVKKGTVLATIHDSPTSALELLTAQRGVTNATAELRIAEDRVAVGLGTNDVVVRTQAALTDARAKLSSLSSSGSSAKARGLQALLDGVVSAVLVQPGDTVPAGGPILQVVDRNSIQVQLTADPNDVALINAGMPVQVEAIGASRAAAVGHITLVADEVDPTTRLVNVLLDVPSDAGLLLNQYVRGRVSVRTERGFIIPRAALVPEDGGYHIVIVDKDTAHFRKVHVGVQTSERVVITGDELRDGLSVVVDGAYQVTDGLAVKAAPHDEIPAKP